jgi:hypothetical protein
MSWWVIVPQGDQSQSDSYKEQVDFRVQFAAGSSQDTALTKRQVISYDGMNWVYWKGPFASEAQAQASQNPQSAPSVGQAAKRAVTAAGNDTLNNILGPLFQANIWIRVGEVLFGFILVGIGLAHLTGANNFVAKAVGTVIP